MKQFNTANMDLLKKYTSGVTVKKGLKYINQEYHNEVKITENFTHNKRNQFEGILSGIVN